MLVAAVLLISTTIRLSAFSRRREIGIMRLVGASNRFIPVSYTHLSVSRMLLVMGRNNVLPKKFFGYINPKTHTPTFNIVLTGVILSLIHI